MLFYLINLSNSLLEEVLCFLNCVRHNLPQKAPCFPHPSCPSSKSPVLPLKFQWADLMAKGALIPKEEGRRGRGKEGCSPRYLFLSCLRFKRRATLHVQLTGCLPARFSRDSIVLCQAWRALCATWAGGDPQMCTKPLRFPLTLALFLEMRKCRVARLHRQQFYV